MRFCELGDNKPVWGTDRKTGIGYCKSHQYLRTDISKETILQKAIKKQRQSVSKSTGTKVRNLVNSNPDIKPPKDYRSKSQLLKGLIDYFLCLFGIGIVIRTGIFLVYVVVKFITWEIRMGMAIR